MTHITVNGIPLEVETGTTLLEAAQFLGFPIPTLCHMEGLSPYGACRLCVVEVGEGPRSKLVSSCTYVAEEGQKVRTSSARVVRARKMIIELLLATCPQSKVIQDLASAHDVRQQRFRQEREDCILCGRCVRMCEEQMVAKAIGFAGRGESRRIGTPFDRRSEVCRTCGGCSYVCPACQLRCTYTDMVGGDAGASSPGPPQADKAICGGCANLAPPCIEKEQFDDLMCFMKPCVACEIPRS